MIHFGDRKRKLDQTRRVAFRVPLGPDTRAVDWETAEPIDVMPEALAKEAPVAAPYLPLPAGAMEIKTFARWAKNFDRWLARTQRLSVTGADGSAEAIGPKRGGVSVELVAVFWDLR